MAKVLSYYRDCRKWLVSFKDAIKNKPHNNGAENKNESVCNEYEENICENESEKNDRKKKSKS